VGNLWQKLSSAGRFVYDILCASENKLTSDSIKNMVNFKYSEVGSNRREREEETAYSFSLYLEQLECELFFT